MDEENINSFEFDPNLEIGVEFYAETKIMLFDKIIDYFQYHPIYSFCGFNIVDNNSCCGLVLNHKIYVNLYDKKMNKKMKLKVQCDFPILFKNKGYWISF